MIAEFIPKTFEAGSSYMHAWIEEDSELTTNTIAHSKYIKPEERHTKKKQKTAHVILGFNNRDSANKAVECGLYVEGKEIKVHKLLYELKRCIKCQHYRHYTADCKASVDTCLRCAGEH